VGRLRGRLRPRDVTGLVGVISSAEEAELAQLLAGELDPEAEAALLARVARSPELRAAWARLQSVEGGAPITPPPERGGGGRALPWGAAALSLLVAIAVAAWPRPGPEVRIGEGAQRISGEARVIAGEVAVSLDGDASLAVEATGAAEPSVTVAVHEGSATLRVAGRRGRELAAGQTVRIGPPALADEPDAEAVALASRVRELEAQNELLQELLEGVELELRGAPVPWSDELPDVLRPAAFERTVRDAVASCAPAAAIVGFECSEPPCLALLRGVAGPIQALVADCPAWRDRYGSGAVAAAGRADCLDGGEERYQVLGWSDRLIEPTEGYPREKRENLDKRMAARLEEIERSWRCAR
jgi:hypothetical protein